MAGFGSMIIWDHPFMVFPMSQDRLLHLPCGSIPTALTEDRGQDQTTTTIQIGVPGAPPMSWEVMLTAEETQAIFRDGTVKLNRAPDGPAALPFKP